MLERIFYAARRRLALFALLGGALACGAVAAQPTTLRLGTGGAAEEQLWLLQAKPDVGTAQGKHYTLDVTRFAGAEKRFQALEASALDVATASANSAMLAASEGADFRIIASLSRESLQGFATKYFVKQDSPIKTVQDLKGKTIGINALNSSTHLWARMVLEKNGLNPDRDVTFTPVSFPAQGEALRSGKIDIGAFPQPFATAEEKRGGVRQLFTSKDGVPFDEELMVLIASPDALKSKGDAIKGLLGDLVASTRYYIQHPQDARKELISAKLVRISPDIYLPMSDYYRDPSARVDVGALRDMQKILVEKGFQRKAVDVEKLVDLSYLPGK
ncbi:MAG: ABC transporter substrate-binding protein [Pigmentiphaga sp.]|uniref:ABC transporter substrate-binding protein n=1 Tax=Pigmentiphaga sp. TaxID=1977564 RepID=UPI0029AE24D9|nr:ABC transporter substrate-binding protein [Pigmentiphaga sp.]MDX3907095.1 ABC transporter substrate-binding protein [Pigmentiphaga sp.]